MPKLDYRNIEKDAARCGGQPVVLGTRIRVATILACYRQGMRVEEDRAELPGAIKPADVHDALAYAYDHMDEIEADLTADEELAVKDASCSRAVAAMSALRFFTDEDIGGSVVSALHREAVDVRLFRARNEFETSGRLPSQGMLVHYCKRRENGSPLERR